MADFPAHLFRMEGDPGSIRSSASKWSTFGTAAADASSQITAIDTGQFIGTEGDLFRQGLNQDMPRHLQITGDAFNKVAGALSGFAGTLESLQEQMRPVAARAPGLWAAVQAAQGRVDRASSADTAHQKQRDALPADQQSQPDPYHSDSSAASSALSEAQRQWQACVDQANGLRGQQSDAVQTAVRAIAQAKGSRFKENPKWWDLGGQFTNFVRDHKDFLKKLSGALKIVSLVAGLLSFIPVLAPIMGPIAIGAGLLAGAIDLSVYAATGEGNLTNILIDIGLSLLPGAGKLLGKLRSLRAVGEVAYGSTDLSRAVKAARAGLPNPETLRNGAIFEYLSNGRRVLSDVAWSRPGVHAERAVWQTLSRLGVQPEQVTRIYSELEPCIIPTPAAGCKAFISRMFSNARVTWSFEYGDAASRAAGNAARQNLFSQLFSSV